VAKQTFQEPTRLPYERYAFSENGVSPRLFPGMSEHLVVVDSDEHTQDGHITEDLSVRIDMVRKRMRKLEGLKSCVIPPVYDGENHPDLLLVSWGSTQGAVYEAALRLRALGKNAATLHFPQVWPLVSEQFLGILESAREVVCIESNFNAQFAKLLRRETGFHISREILRYDGLPITPGYILEKLESHKLG
jgi:2-oxoglutarate ferredoxin oxidoreductase subunit alpha